MTPQIDQIVQAVTAQIVTDLFPCSTPGKKFYPMLQQAVRIGVEQALRDGGK